MSPYCATSPTSSVSWARRRSRRGIGGEPQPAEQRAVEGGDRGDRTVRDAQDVKCERPVAVVARPPDVAGDGGLAVDVRDLAAHRPEGLGAEAAVDPAPDDHLAPLPDPGLRRH